MFLKTIPTLFRSKPTRERRGKSPPPGALAGPEPLEAQQARAIPVHKTRARSGAFTAALPHGPVSKVASPSSSNSSSNNQISNEISNDISHPNGSSRHITSSHHHNHHHPSQAPLEACCALKPPRPLPPLPPTQPPTLVNNNNNNSSSSRSSLPVTPTCLPHSPFTTSTTTTCSSHPSTTSIASARQRAAVPPPLPPPLVPRTGASSPNPRTALQITSPSSKTTFSTGTYLNTPPPPPPPPPPLAALPSSSSSSASSSSSSSSSSSASGSSGIPKPRVAPKSNALSALGSCSTSSSPSPSPSPYSSANQMGGGRVRRNSTTSRRGVGQQSRTDREDEAAVAAAAAAAALQAGATAMSRSPRGEVSATTSHLQSVWETKTAGGRGLESSSGGGAQRRDTSDDSTASSGCSSLLSSSAVSSSRRRRLTGGSNMGDLDLQGCQGRPSSRSSNNNSMTHNSFHASHVNNPLDNNKVCNNRIRSLTSSAHAATAIVTAVAATGTAATTPSPRSPTTAASSTTPSNGVPMVRGRSQGSPVPPRGYSKSVSAPISLTGYDASAVADASGTNHLSSGHTTPIPVASSPSYQKKASATAVATGAGRVVPPSTTPAHATAETPTSHPSSTTQTSSTSSSSSPTSPLSAAAAQSNGLTHVASSVDLVGRRLREEQLQAKVKAAREFIETTVGQCLPHADLHECLKDGVILCKLANRLRPGTVEQISLKNLPFVKMENISNFLNAAKKLGVQSSDLFETADLYKGKDMVQVVSTILTLARVVGSIGKPLQAQKTTSSSMNKRPGPAPLVVPDLEEGLQPIKSTIGVSPSSSSAQPLTRLRSKTAHTPSIASSTPVIRPSNSSYYAAQIRKLEEDSIRYSTGIEQLQRIGLPVVPPVILPPPPPPPSQPTVTSTKERHLSAPVPPKAQLREKASRRPSLDDIVAGVESSSSILDTEMAASGMSRGSRASDPYLESATRTTTILEDDEGEVVFTSANRPTQQQKTRFPRSTSGSALPPLDPSTPSSMPFGSHLSTLAPSSIEAGAGAGRRRKKSISLDPQAANAIMHGKRSVYRDGLASPVSPGLTSSVSHSAINITTSIGQDGVTFRQHSRFASEKVDLTSVMIGSPSNSRSSTPVQGLRKSANSTEPLREKLDLVESGRVAATFQLGNCIGRGQFGAVYKALNLGTGQMVAVKRIKVDGLKDAEMDILMQEVELLKTLSHPSIVKYEGFIKSFGYLNIILEFVENGSLLTTLKAFGTFPEKLVVAYVVKILEGLVYLHGKEVVHCDLKAANILTTKNGNVKLSDFGVSLNMKVKESDFGAVAGTPNWMAPEVIELKGASPASDIWSLGCTIIEMLTGRPPYADLLAMTTLFRIVEDDRPPLPNNISADLLDFLCQCFQKNPTLRPSASKLSHHRWIVRNFNGRELKPMDSLPFIKRKSLEPREQGAVATAVDRQDPVATTTTTTTTMTTTAATTKRALTPAGLSSGAPPMAASAIAIPSGVARSNSRRASVDSAAGGLLYSSATAPAAVQLSEKYPPMSYDHPTGRMHQFVKSSFAKPVECRFCHESVKSRAVICQDCNLVFHKKCQTFVGETCFPNVISFFPQTPTPAQSVPNLKMVANGMQANNDSGSRPSSRTSMNSRERARSVTPSHQKSRPFPLTGSSPIERGDEYYASEHAHSSSALGPYGRPSSRQSINNSTTSSPTSPTLAGLKNFIAGSRRFAFGNKKHGTTTPEPSHGPAVAAAAAATVVAAAAAPTSFGQGYMASLPTPPTSISSTTSFVSSGGGSSMQEQQQRPSRPASQSAVPITKGSGGRRHREYLVGLVDHDEVDELAMATSSSSSFGMGVPGSSIFNNNHARPSAISLFSTSAPSSQMHYGGRTSPLRGQPRRIKHSASSTTLKGLSDDDEEEDEEDAAEEDDEDGVTTTGRFHAGRHGKHKHMSRDLEEDDLDVLLVPSAATPTKAAQAATSANSATTTTTSTAAVAACSFKSSSPSRISYGAPLSSHVSTARQQYPPRHRDSGSSVGTEMMHAHEPVAVSLLSQSMVNGGGPATATRQNGYNSSGSSTAAMTSSYSSMSNNSSPASSLGSVAALLEEEERMMLAMGSGGTANNLKSSGAGYMQGSSNHVGIRTMLNRFNHHAAATQGANGSSPVAASSPPPAALGAFGYSQRPVHPLQTLSDDGEDNGHYFASMNYHHHQHTNFDHAHQDFDMDTLAGVDGAREVPLPPEVHVLTPGGRRQTGFSKFPSVVGVNGKASAPELAHVEPSLGLTTTVPAPRQRRHSRVSRRELGL